MVCNSIEFWYQKRITVEALVSGLPQDVCDKGVCNWSWLLTGM